MTSPSRGVRNKLVNLGCLFGPSTGDGACWMALNRGKYHRMDSLLRLGRRSHCVTAPLYLPTNPAEVMSCPLQLEKGLVAGGWRTRALSLNLEVVVMNTVEGRIQDLEGA